MKYVGMCFKDSNRIYTFKSNLNLEKDKSYLVITDGEGTYGSSLRFIGEVEAPKNPTYKVKEITEVVKVE